MITHSTHHIHFYDRRVRKIYIKATLAYGGAFLMTIDAGCAVIGPLLFPHVLHMSEYLIGCTGKVGAAFSGVAVFFDRIVITALREIEHIE